MSFSLNLDIQRPNLKIGDDTSWVYFCLFYHLNFYMSNDDTHLLILQLSVQFFLYLSVLRAALAALTWQYWHSPSQHCSQ